MLCLSTQAHPCTHASIYTCICPAHSHDLARNVAGHLGMYACHAHIPCLRVLVAVELLMDRLKRTIHTHIMLACACRSEAIDRQIEADRRRRQAVEEAKRRELDVERAGLSEWQKSIGDQGAESDYESDGSEAEVGVDGAAAESAKASMYG